MWRYTRPSALRVMFGSSMSIVRSRSPKYSLLHIYVVLGRSTQHDAHRYASHRTWLFISYDSYALVDERIMFYFSKYKTKPHFFVKNDVIDLALNDPDPDPCRFLFPDPPFTITGRSLVRWI